MKKGFTLIELLVVVLIIGILSAIALPQYQVAVAKSRLTQGFILAQAIQQAEERNYLAAGEYTTDLDALDISLGNYTVESNVEDFIKIKLSNKVKINIALNGYGGPPDRVEILLPDGYFEGIMFYFNQHSTAERSGHWCFGKSDVYKKACQSMGGVDKDTFGGAEGGRAYKLPI